MLKVIYVDNSEALKSVLNQFNGAFSNLVSAILVTDEECSKIQAHYNVESGEEHEDFGDVLIESLDDFLETAWEEKEISIPVAYASQDNINIALCDNIEIATQPYDTDNYIDHADNVAELLASEDWYKAITQETTTILLEVFLDDIKLTIGQMVENLD